MNSRPRSPVKRPRSRKKPRAKHHGSRGPSGLVRALAGGALSFVFIVVGLFIWGFIPGAVTGDRTELREFQVLHKSRDRVVEDLRAQGLVEGGTLLLWYMRLVAPFAELEQRGHLVSGGLSGRELMQRLSGGGSRASVKVTIPEGWNHLQIAERLVAKGVCPRADFISAVFDRVLLDELEVTAPSAEGFLFPATYQFRVDERAEKVVRKLVKETAWRIESLKKDHPPHADLEKLRFGTWEVLTLASVVEKETAHMEEAPRVARVFLNRLLDPAGVTSGRLQSDPTAAYGCLVDRQGLASCAAGEGRVTPEMLLDSANPYNTYRHPGLPPGPIANPGERAIVAVLDPAEGRELFFVGDGAGQHRFSETFEDHRKAVEQLRKVRGTAPKAE